MIASLESTVLITAEMVVTEDTEVGSMTITKKKTFGPIPESILEGVVMTLIEKPNCIGVEITGPLNTDEYAREKAKQKAKLINRFESGYIAALMNIFDLKTDEVA